MRHRIPLGAIAETLLWTTLVLYFLLRGFLTVPGYHYDEAWFADYAARILNEPGFWPLQGMNSYTSPVLHYALAGWFGLFDEGVEASRSFYLFLNIVAFLLLYGWLVVHQRRSSARIFALLWACLPITIFLQRIQLEVTSWYVLCVALILWGVGLWKRRPLLAPLLIVAGSWLGIFSHVLFFAMILATVWVSYGHAPRELLSRRGRWTACLGLIGSAIIPVRMALDLGKPQSLVLALAMVLAGVLIAANRIPAFVGKYHGRITLALGALVSPLVLHFLFLNWNGFWNYAQVTGEIHYPWMALNSAFVLILTAAYWRRIDMVEPFSKALLTGFVISMVGVSITVFKLSSGRYWTIPVLWLLFWCATTLPQLWSSPARKKTSLALLAIVFAWNAYFFHKALLDPLVSRGAEDRPFRLWIFNDNAVDYRPSVVVFRWLQSQGCGANRLAVDHGRNAMVVDALQHIARRTNTLDRPTAGPCRQGKSARFWLGKPELLPAGYRLLSLPQPGWGDLAVAVNESASP